MWGKNVWNLIPWLIIVSYFSFFTALNAHRDGTWKSVQPIILWVVTALAGSLIVAIRHIVGIETRQAGDFFYLATGIMMVLASTTDFKITRKTILFPLRLFGLFFASIILFLQVYLPLHFVDGEVTKVDFTRELIFQANFAGTTLLVLMLSELLLGFGTRNQHNKVSFISQSVYLCAIWYVNSDFSLILGSIIFLISATLKIRSNPRNVGTVIFGLLVLSPGVLTFRVLGQVEPSISPSLEGRARFTSRVAETGSPLDSVRFGEWAAILKPDDWSQVFLGLENRPYTHSNLHLISADFGIIYGLSFVLLMAIALWRRLINWQSKLLIGVFLADGLVQSSLTHPALALLFILVASALASETGSIPEAKIIPKNSFSGPDPPRHDNPCQTKKRASFKT